MLAAEAAPATCSTAVTSFVASAALSARCYYRSSLLTVTHCKPLGLSALRLPTAFQLGCDSRGNHFRRICFYLDRDAL